MPLSIPHKTNLDLILLLLECFINTHEKILRTAGGKITCQRCQSASKRTKSQCGRPASKGKFVCNFHGGKSTGPKTEAGKERSRIAHIKNSNFTQESSQLRNCALLELAHIENIIHTLKMTSASRSKGPRPKGYKKLNFQSSLSCVMGTSN